MDFDKIGQKYLFIFYLLGQTPLNPFARPSTSSSLSQSSLASRARRIFHYVPSILFIILVFCESGKFIHNIICIPLDLHVIIFHVFVSGRILLLLFMVQCGPFFNKNIKIIWNKFCELESFTKNEMKMIWHFDSFERTIKLQVFTIIAFYFSRIYSGLAKTELVLDYSQFLFTFVSLGLMRIALLHILVYVNLFKHSLHEVNEHLMKMSRENGIFSVTKKSQHHHIEMVKKVHYKLWEIACGINSNFGWTLTALIVQAANGSLQPTYFIVAIFVESLEEETYSLRIVGKQKKIVILFRERDGGGLRLNVC